MNIIGNINLPYSSKNINKSIYALNKNRLWIVYIFLLLLGIGIIIFLSRWQLFQHNTFSLYARQVSLEKQNLSTKRGNIFLNDGTVVALDKLTGLVFVSAIYPQDYSLMQQHISSLLDYMVSLKEITSQREKDIIDFINKHSILSYYVLDKDISEINLEKISNFIKNNKIRGVFVKRYYKRVYPLGPTLAPVLGFVSTGQNGRGLYGIEGYFWKDISGRNGELLKQATKEGTLVVNGQYKIQKALEGKNIVLTINLNIQKKLQKWLKKGVEEYEAQGGAAIVMNPKTGEILGMASYPTYDPNYYWQTKDYSVFENKAVSYVYEYGSVQKPLTIAIALQNHIIKKNYKCYDSGVLKVLDKKIYNWSYKRYGLLDLMHILRYSDNVCSGTIALKMTPKLFYSYLLRLGLGSLTNVGILEEQTGFLKPYQKWNKVDLAVTGFGQMVTATPLQILSAHSTLANDGVRMQPLLIKRIFNTQDSIDFSPVPLDRIFSEDVARYVRKIMYEATMKVGYLGVLGKKYGIAGKTGTAQIPKKNGPGYEENEVNSTFIGFAPYDNPQMIMLVMLIKPKKKSLAAFSVVPLWKNIFNDIKDDLYLKPKF